MQQSQDPRAVSAQQQQELKQTLREAFAGNDGVNCWAWVIFDHEVTVSATNEAASERGELNADEVQLLAGEGNYVRLIQHVGSNYLFASERVYDETKNKLLFMAHESQFFVRFIGDRPNLSFFGCSSAEGCERYYQMMRRVF